MHTPRRSTAWAAAALLCPTAACSLSDAQTWVIDSQAEWIASTARSEGLQIQDGIAEPEGDRATFRSKPWTFRTPRRLSHAVLRQTPEWQNWNPCPNLGPSNLRDAPVLLSRSPGDYWVFGRYGQANKRQGHRGEPTRLEGFDRELWTTPFARQLDARGGLQPSLGGYHAWQSRDMIHWVHHGPVTEKFSRWVTSAEYANGKLYLFYDYPNDQDPHVYVDRDLFDGKPGEDRGLAFADPSDGSDAGFIRDLQGHFHVVYEDWTPINARQRSWDSPLAGHAVSASGIGGYEILAPAVDERTRNTGRRGQYKHPHWKQHPAWDRDIATYEIHEPEQAAYGDWALLAVGSQYYLFGDFDPVGGHAMQVGWFTTESLGKRFRWCGSIGKGHPDPDVCFAEGSFWLITQQQTDYVSPGPWVQKVEMRVGVDSDGDGATDRWSAWQEVRESYAHTPGVARQVARTPARFDPRGLSEGLGFVFELRLHDTTDNASKPRLDAIQLHFDAEEAR